MASPLDIKMTKNNDISILFTTRDKTGVPVNITDFHIIWEVRKSHLAEALITKTTADGISIIDSVNGKFTITLEAIDTVNLNPGSYYHQATLTDNVGNSVSLTGLGGATGVFQLLPQIAVQIED